jgi:hypothetical protein
MARKRYGEEDILAMSPRLVNILGSVAPVSTASAKLMQSAAKLV